MNTAPRPHRFLHQLNPLAKVGGPLPAMIALLVTRDILTPLVFLVLAVVLLLVGAALTARTLIGLLVVLPALVAVMAISFGLWADAAELGPSPVLLTIGDYRFTLAALSVGTATSVRLAAVVVLALVGGLTTSGTDLVRAMVRQLHMPYRLGYTALAALRFVPRFRHELEVIRQAHRVRGMTGGRGPLAAVRRWLGYAVPLLAGAIRHAERVALAMDSRGFGAHPTRTERVPIPFRVRDGMFMAAFWAASAAIFVALRLG